MPKVLKKFIFNDTTTVDIMDQFEGYTGNIRYDQLLIENNYCLMIKDRDNNDHFITYQFVIERASKYCNWDDDPKNEITFTNFKLRKIYNLKKYVHNQNFIYEDAEKAAKSGEVLLFDKPFHFKAQNSSDREGYGWEWYGGTPVIIGTEYGQTTDYVIVGIKVVYGTDMKKAYKPAPPKIVCPKCGSDGIGTITKRLQNKTFHRCSDCGYTWDKE